MTYGEHFDPRLRAQLMRYIAPLLLAFALVAVAWAEPTSSVPAPVTQAIVLDNDPGGEVGTYIAWFTRIKDAGVHVRVLGLCKSACTLVLGLPKEQFCVEPTASFGFHLVSTVSAVGKLIVLPADTYALSRRYYPPAVQRWLKEQKLRLELIYLSADDLVQMGAALPCH